MKIRALIRTCIIAFALVFTAAGSGVAFSQAPAAAHPGQVVGSGKGTGKANELDSPETHSETEAFRHSAVVGMLARRLHISIETTAQIFEDLNSAILIIAVLVALWKWLPKTFRARSETIRQQIVDAQTATEAAGQRLSAIESRLAMLNTEIEGMRQQAERDSVEDERRIRQSMEEERERIVKSAEHAIAAASGAAQRELKRFTANLAVERALSDLHLTAGTDRILVRDFEQGLTPELGKPDLSKVGRN